MIQQVQIKIFATVFISLTTVVIGLTHLSSSEPAKEDKVVQITKTRSGFVDPEHIRATCDKYGVKREPAYDNFRRISLYK